jgi:NADH dehydrogenase/NADH:ubiquinone oxidoreductase subunit G
MIQLYLKCLYSNGIKPKEINMKITLDNGQVAISPEDKNIIDVADRVGIGIPAPCYRDNGKGGCCKSCVVEIDGEKVYACGTKPQDGMNIIVKREDLELIGKERALAYREEVVGILSGCGCCCNPPKSEGNCC